jgi:hypothetical protein
MYHKFKPQSIFTGHTMIEGGNTVVVTKHDGNHYGFYRCIRRRGRL